MKTADGPESRVRDASGRRSTAGYAGGRHWSMPANDAGAHHVPAPDEPSIPELEEDEDIAPRPEEEIADELRAKPDVGDHSADERRSSKESPL